MGEELHLRQENDEGEDVKLLFDGDGVDAAVAVVDAGTDGD